MLKLLLLMALAQSPIAEAHVGKSGTTVFATPPDGSTTAPVVTTPVLWRDGRYTTLTSGPVSDGFRSWTLPVGVRLNPGDALRLTAPAGWIDGAPALDLPVRNSVGRVEFDVPKPTMALGAGFARNPLDPTALYCPVRNWAVRLGAWDSNCVATDPSSGLPTKTKGPTSARFVMADAQRVPTPSGLWTVCYDTADYRTVVSVTADNPAQWVATYRGDLSSPGKAGGQASLRGIVRVYQVVASVGATSISPRLSLTVDHPLGAPQLSNLRVLPPGNAPDADALAPEQSVSDALSIGGGRGPSVLRWNGATGSATGDSNVVEPEDLATAKAGSWASPGRTLTAQIASIRPLELAISPAITGTPWGDLPVPSKAIWDSTSRLVCEVVTAAPHGFRSGQLASLNVHSDTPLSVTVAGSPVSCPIPWGLMTPVWVTSPTSFAVSFRGAGLPPSGVCDIDAPVTPANATVTVRVPGVALMPYEFAAATTSRFAGCACWVSIPSGASDACVDEIGRRVLSRLGAGNRLIFEVGNETWNFGYPGFEYFTTLSRVFAASPNPGHAYVRRTAEVRDRLRAVFAAAGRPDDVLSALNVQWGNSATILGRAAAQGLQADIVAYAPYYSLPGSWAAPCANWTAAQMHDLARHHVVLDPRYRLIARTQADQIAAYEAAIGKRVLRYAYEAAIEQPIPAGSPNLEARTWDWLYHPDNADTDRLYYATLQAMGLDVAIYSSSWIEPRADGFAWGLWNWQGQRSGPGGRNVPWGWPGWTENESVRGFAWVNWQRGYWLGRVP